MLNWLKKTGQSAANFGGKLIRGVAHVTRVGFEKGAELAGAGVDAVSEVAASAVGLMSERGEQVVRDTGKTIVKAIETPGKTIGKCYKLCLFSPPFSPTGHCVRQIFRTPIAAPAPPPPGGSGGGTGPSAPPRRSP